MADVSPWRQPSQNDAEGSAVRLWAIGQGLDEFDLVPDRDAVAAADLEIGIVAFQPEDLPRGIGPKSIGPIGENDKSASLVKTERIQIVVGGCQPDGRTVGRSPDARRQQVGRALARMGPSDASALPSMAIYQPRVPLPTGSA